MPQISVIVPVYNSEQYLNRCLDSVLAQTFVDFELLLINDGSTDCSARICEEYAIKDSRVRVCHKENGGAASARNKGLEMARGTWITFCDSDDWVYPNWLSNFSSNWDRCDLVCQGIECSKPLCSEPQKERPYRYGINYFGSIRVGLEELIQSRIVGYTVIKCFKRDLINCYRLRFNTQLTVQEDEEFVVRYMLRCDTMKCVDLVGYNYDVPNFKTKYVNLIKQYEANKLLYMNVKPYKNKGWNKVIDYYAWFYVFEFIIMYESVISKRKLLLSFRKTLGSDILRTRLFSLTKLIIYLDFTGFIATVVLNVHLKLKAFVAKLEISNLPNS